MNVPKYFLDPSLLIYKLDSAQLESKFSDQQQLNRAFILLKRRIERILKLTMTLSKMITFTVTTISLAQAVSIHFDIKRGGTDPIVQLRMHDLIELISHKGELGLRTAVTQKVKDGGKLKKALQQAIYNNQWKTVSKNQSRRKPTKSSRFNRYKKFHSVQKS